ncbi:MAG TPA: adenosine deaminase [Terriglobales bacterium]|nr:adenosine deaminase [Terriglobales bacterium]
MAGSGQIVVKDASELTPSAFILALPKAELHLHLEGAVEPATLLELSARHGGLLRAADVEALYRYPDFAGFLMAFKTVTDYLRTPEDYELITYRLMERLKAENVVHAEVYISVGVVQWRGLDFAPIFEGLERGRARGAKDFGVSLLWIFDAVRHFGPQAAERVLDQALRYRERHVAGIGIGGDEQRAAPEIFREVYLRAREAGLRLTAHAGESAGPESVLGALDALGAERIGHGLNAWHDRELLARLRRQQVPLELCPTSNLRTGCCRALEQHPLRSYFDQGLLVTLNSDDPAMFRTSLAREYALAHEAFGFRDDELRTLARNSFRASFLPEERKQAYLAQIA